MFGYQIYLSRNGMIMGQVMGDNGVSWNSSEMITVCYCQDFYPPAQFLLVYYYISYFGLIVVVGAHDNTI